MSDCLKMIIGIVPCGFLFLGFSPNNPYSATQQADARSQNQNYKYNSKIEACVGLKKGVGRFIE